MFASDQMPHLDRELADHERDHGVFEGSLERQEEQTPTNHGGLHAKLEPVAHIAENLAQLRAADAFEQCQQRRRRGEGGQRQRASATFNRAGRLAGQVQAVVVEREEGGEQEEDAHRADNGRFVGKVGSDVLGGDEASQSDHGRENNHGGVEESLVQRVEAVSQLLVHDRSVLAAAAK